MNILKVFFLLSMFLGSSISMKKDRRNCPTECVCSSDQFGRKTTICETGGMADIIPVSSLIPDTQVLIITGNENQPNNLSLGPIFKNMKKLQEIHLTWSGIPSIGEHSFWGLRYLNVLNISHNCLTNLVDTNFRGATSLKSLDLSFNEIESIPSATFRHIKHLESLSLASNMIPRLVPRIFFGLTRLKKLDLSFNPLGDLQPELFSDVPVLTEFSCSGCGLLSISGSLLKMMPHLNELDLCNNRLTQIPHRIMILEELETLKLDGNHISFVEKGSVSGSPIQNLHLSHNHIIRVESEAFSNSSITHLDLSYNRLSNINSESLSGSVQQLVDLKLSGNSLRIEDLLAILPEADRLRRLSLGDIGLTLLPAGLMHHSYSLDYLNVSANYLSILPLDLFSSTPYLSELDLSYNNFRGLDENVLNAIVEAKDLRILRLQGNPWQCDKCHASPLVQWLQNSPDQESGCEDPRVWSCLTCVWPRKFSGVSLAFLPEGDIPDCNNDDFAKEYPSPTNFMHPGRVIVPSSYMDDNSKPQSHSTRTGTRSLSNILHEELPLVILGACLIVIFLLIMIIVSVIVYTRHSAYYYTNEKAMENTSYFVCDRRLMSPELRNGKSPIHNGLYTNFSNGDNGLAYNTVNGFKTGQRNNNTKIPLRPRDGNNSPTIATIDELADIAGSTELVDAVTPTNSLDLPQTTEISILETELNPGTG